VNRLSRLITVAACVLGAMVAVACANETTGPSAQLTKGAHRPPKKPLGFTRCTPQPAAANSARIGPSGGTLRAGKHMLRLPAGALKRSVIITMVSPSDSLNYVVFEPEGLTFDPANLPTLVMSYGNCAVQQPEDLEIVYADDSLTAILETTESVPADTLNHTVGARLKHFSNYVLKRRYAVAY
jgi:hypothetical protein